MTSVRILLVAVLCAHLAAGTSTQTPAPRFTPTVGLEVELSVSIPGTAVEVVPVDEQLPLRLLIVEQHAAGEATRCRIRYRGLRAGVFDVAPYLRRVDGSTNVAIPPILVDIVPVLRSGELIDVPMVPHAVPVDLPTGEAWPWIIGGAWLAVLPLGWWWLGRSRVVQRASTSASDLAAVVRPLASLAIDNRLSVDGWARLERALFSYWQLRLGLSDRDGPELLRTLLDHDESGPVLRAVRGWLHERDDSAHASALDLLQPFAREDAS